MSAPREELVDYLLGEMPPADRARLEDRLAQDQNLRLELERLRPVVSGVADLPDEAWERLEPPPLELPLTDTPQEPDRPFLGWLRDFALGARMPVIGVATAATAALALGVGIGLFVSADGDDGAERTAAVMLEPVTGATSAQGEAVVLDAQGDGQVELDVTGLPPSDPGTAYELWLLNSPDDLVSLGTFTVPMSGERSVSVPLPVEPTEFAFFDISVEPVGGDGSHSGQSVLRGATA